MSIFTLEIGRADRWLIVVIIDWVILSLSDGYIYNN
jgi:hypothetical protein